MDGSVLPDTYRSEYRVVVKLTIGDQSTKTAEEIYLSLIGLHRGIWFEELQSRGYVVDQIVVWDDEESIAGGQFKARRDNPNRFSMCPKMRVFTTTKVISDDLEEISQRIDSETHSTLNNLSLEGVVLSSRSGVTSG